MFLTGGNHSPLCSICGSSFPIAFHISPPPVPLPATFTSPYSLSFPPMFHGNVLLTDCTGSWVSQNQADPIPLPFFPYWNNFFLTSQRLNSPSASWNSRRLSSFKRITLSSLFSLSVLIKGAFKYKASATTTSAKCPCLFLSRSIRRFPPYLSRIHPLTLTFPAPSITCGAFPIVMHTMSRWNHSVCPDWFFRIRHSGHFSLYCWIISYRLSLL